MNNQWRDHSERFVLWGDGTYDWQRSCDACGSSDCDSSVHTDRYKEIGTTNTDAVSLSDESFPANSYWPWMHTVKPKGSKVDFDGQTLVGEFDNANPDNLAERPTRQSGVTEEQQVWLEEAFNALPPMQQKVWQLVMREQHSEPKVVELLHIKRTTVQTHLQRAKASITSFLREKQDND